METNTPRPLLLATAFFSIFFFSACAEFNDPYYQRPSGSGYDPYYDRSSDYDYYRERELERERREVERDRAQAERDRYEAERARREAERAREQAQQSRPSSISQPDRCPPGFHPSEQKCSSQDRKRGCKDIRTPGGLGCRNM